MRRMLFMVYLGLAAGGLFIGAVFLTGGTFGQRCAKLWAQDTPAWNDCVERFATGRNSP